MPFKRRKTNHPERWLIGRKALRQPADVEPGEEFNKCSEVFIESFLGEVAEWSKAAPC